MSRAGQMTPKEMSAWGDLIRLATSVKEASELAEVTLERYGPRFQRAKCIGEMAELRIALLEIMGYPEVPKGKPPHQLIDNVIDEACDVIITAISAASTTGDGWIARLAERIDFKIRRTLQRIDNEKKEGNK